MMRSIQARLLMGTLIGSCVVMSALGLILFQSIRSILAEEFDEALTDKARALAATVEMEDGSVEAEFTEYHLPEFSRPQRAEYFLLRRVNGEVVAQSTPQGGEPLRATVAAGAVFAVGEITLPDGRPGRYVALPFAPTIEEKRGRLQGSSSSVPSLVLILARDTLDLQRVLGHMRVLLWIVGGVTTAILGGLMVVSVRAGLKPLRGLAARIGAMEAGDLSARLPADHLPAELSPVAARLNELLARLEAAWSRERAFTADVAHDLRTPLAGLRSTMEVALSRERTGAEYQETLQDSLTITQQMQTLTNNLLALARAEAGQLRIERRPVDLEPLIQSAWQPFAARADERGIRVQCTVPPTSQAVTDPGQLRLVLGNLFDNATTYVNPGGEIIIETTCREGRTSIEIANTGNTLSSADAARVFDRFWRGDASRKTTGAHYGLGLSLVKRVVELLGGTTRAQVHGEQFSVRVDLPAVVP